MEFLKHLILCCFISGYPGALKCVVHEGCVFSSKKFTSDQRAKISSFTIPVAKHFYCYLIEPV